MDYTIKIDPMKGTADIEFDKSDISGEYKRSPNGKYYMICDTLYTSNGGKEHTVLFTENEVLYKKALPNNALADDFILHDDGSAIIITEEHFLILASDGTQLIKKNVSLFQNGFYGALFWGTGDNANGDSVLFIYNTQTGKATSKVIPDNTYDLSGFCGSILWRIGDNDNGEMVLFLYDMEKSKSVLRVIPDIEYDDEEKEDLFSSEVEAIFTGEKFVFVYKNRIDAVAYDLTGTKVTPTDEEIAQANAQRDEHEREEQLRRIEKAKSSYQYWSERVVREKEEGKSSAEIERSICEVEKYRQKLLEFGIEVPGMPACEEDPKPVAAAFQKNRFVKWFKK